MRRRAFLALAAPCPAAAATPESLRAQGDAWRALDEFRAALAAYDAALALAPGDAALLADRALTLHRLGETEAARGTLARAIERAGPAEPWPHTVRAGLALLAREDAAAAADLAEAARRDPGDARVAALARLLAARRGAGPPPDAAALDALRRAFGPWLDP
jgi:tetratricopeptide (TPR) repeat protein